MKEYHESKSPKEWIDRCEEDFRARLEQIADRIATTEGLRMISLTGPTCSGKTTAANLLTRLLAKRLITVHLISIDDFYFNKEKIHQITDPNGTGEVDYESIRCIDLEELSRFIAELSRGSAPQCPIFDFSLGKRIGYREIPLGEKDIFIFEGIQVLYPEIQSLLSPYPTLGIYIEPKSVLEESGVRFDPNEIRFLRRIVRDFNFRRTTPEETMTLWRAVRRNEEKNIFPFSHLCALHIDSTMPYELRILCPYLKKLLSSVSKDSPFGAEAERILTKIRNIEPLSDALLPSDSLYKEFV